MTQNKICKFLSSNKPLPSQISVHPFHSNQCPVPFGQSFCKRILFHHRSVQSWVLKLSLGRGESWRRRDILFYPRTGIEIACAKLIFLAYSNIVKCWILFKCSQYGTTSSHTLASDIVNQWILNNNFLVFTNPFDASTTDLL